MSIWQLRLPVFSSGGIDGGTGTPPPGTPPAGTGEPPPKKEDGGTGKAGSALELPPEKDDKVITAPADWPDDWKAKIAGDDKDVLKRLERFKSPGELWKSYSEADKKIRSGKALSDEPMPDPAKDADAAKAWRKERGIPDEPSGYELPKAITDRLTDEDKPVLASFTEFAHKKGARPDVVSIASEWYLESQEQAHAARVAADAKQAETTQDDLRAEYGKEFRPNVTLAKRFAEEVTPGVPWFEARLEDGRKLGNIPEFVKALVELGTQKYGDVAFAGGEASSKTQTRKAEIEAIRDENFKAYEGNAKLQAEYLEILKAEEKRGAKR